MEERTRHYGVERVTREQFINEVLDGDGVVVDRFIVDKHHRNGKEYHSITTHGIIIIHNVRTGRLITKLIARPQQIKRYYESTGRVKPIEYMGILKLAKRNQCLGYNNI